MSEEKKNKDDVLKPAEAVDNTLTDEANNAAEAHSDYQKDCRNPTG